MIALKCRCNDERVRNQEPKSSSVSLVDDVPDSKVRPKWFSRVNRKAAQKRIICYHFSVAGD